jgi:hypothetical protein
MDRTGCWMPRWNGGAMSEIAELFSRNVLEKPHTDEELNLIIEYLRQQRREQAEREARGLRPRKPVKD